MKKAYKKPMMIVEWFTLSQTIAAGCGENASNLGEPLHARKADCAWDFWGIIIFENSDACVEKSEVYGELCYNAPADGYNVFHS